MGNLTPVVVRPNSQQISNATETIIFSSIPINERRYDRCPISHETFTENTPVTRIRHCGHYFDPMSLTTLFRSSVRCPVCRYDIREYTNPGNETNNTTDNNSESNSNTNTNSHTEEPLELDN